MVSAEDTMVTASGMAAISTTLLPLLSAGNHLLAQSAMYGGTPALIARKFEKLGITEHFINGDDLAYAPLRHITRRPVA